MRILLFLFIPITLFGQTFKPNDIRIGDSTASYLDFEFWQSGHRMCFQDENNRGYVAMIDSLTGNLRSANGKDFLFDNALAPITSSINGPEWGFSKLGAEVVYTKQVGNARHIGKAIWNGASYTNIDLSANLSNNRFAVIGSKDWADAQARLVYAKGNSIINFEINWSAASTPLADSPIPYGQNSSSGPRWIDGEQALLTNDLVGGTIQIFRYDIATAKTKQLTFDAGNKIDAFIFSAPDYSGDRLLFCTVNDTLLRLYRETTNGFNKVYDIKIPDPSYGYYFSAEPFVFKGKSYLFVCAAQQKFIPGSQNNSKPADVWIVGLDIKRPLFRKISDNRVALRLDPEVFVTPTEAYVYYYEYKQNGNVHPVALHKCNTGLGSNPLEDAQFTLNVINGFGSGLYAAGDTVHIFANPNGSNQVFDRWQSSALGLVALPTLREYHTRIVMPKQNTTLTATYQTVPTWSFIESTIANKKLFYYFPAKMKGVILAFHGAGGSATGWIGGVENDNFHRYAVAHGYGILVTESNDRTQKRWANSPVSASNADIVSINQILANLKTTGKLTGNEKLFAIGHSQGSGFGSVIAYIKNFTASAQYGVNGNDGVFAVSTVPTIWNASRADTSADNQRLKQFYGSYNTYLTRGITAELRVLEPSLLFSERFLRIPNISLSQAQGIFNDLKTANYLNEKNYFKVNPRLNETYINSIMAVPNSFDGDIDDQVTVAFTEHKFYSDHNFLTIDFFDRQLGITTDLVEVEQDQIIKVYPNPFIDKIQVQNYDLDLEFGLIDHLGRRGYQGKNIAQRDFSDLPAGMYFLVIDTDKGNRIGVEKLLKLQK